MKDYGDVIYPDSPKEKRLDPVEALGEMLADPRKNLERFTDMIENELRRQEGVLQAIKEASPQVIKDLEPDRKKIVLSMQDIIRRYGAVWIENVSTSFQQVDLLTDSTC